MDNNLKEFEEKMKTTINIYSDELKSIRAGRANPAILDKISVPYYGQNTPLNQVAGISVPEARLIAIQPWDASLIGPIEKELLKSDIGITPSNDGKVIRLAIPPLTTERRTELTKTVSGYGENAKISVRNIRREAMDFVKKLEKNGDYSEDDRRDSETDIQELTDKYIKEIDKITASKQEEIMEI